MENRLASTAFLDTLLEGFQIVDREFRYVYVNPAAARHGRTTPEALFGRTMMECYPGIDDSPMFQELTYCMVEREPRVMLNEFEHHDGSTGWYELRMMPVEEGVFILSVDVTERVSAEHELHRAHRAVRALSVCNRTLVRAKTEEQFAADVCRLVTDDASYQVVWLTLRPPIGDRPLRQYAASRTPEEPPPLPKSGLVRAKIEAAFEGESAIIQERLTEDVWPEGVAAGLQSVIVIPVKGPAEVFGVLVLGSDDPDSFDDEERSLIEEIGWDLGFGIQTLRLRVGYESELSLHRETRREHSTLVSNLPGMAYRCLNDDDWTMLSVSDGCLPLTGYPRDVLLDPTRRGFAQLIVPEDAADVHEEVDRAIAEGRRFVIEYRIQHADGGIRWISERGIAVASEDDQVVLEGFMSDVTFRKEAAAAEYDLNRRLLELAETVQRIAAAEDFDAITFIVTTGARRLLGAERAALATRIDDDMCRFDVESADSPALEGKTLPLEKCVDGWAILNAEPAIVTNVSDDDRAPNDLYAPLDAVSILSVPLRDPIGALTVYWSTPRQPSLDDIEILQALSDAGAVALANMRAFHALAEREALLTAVQQALPSALLIWRGGDDGLALAAANEAARRLHPEIDGLIGAGPEVVEDVFPGLGRYLERCLASKRVQRIELETSIAEEPCVFELTLGYVAGDFVIVRADDVTVDRDIERRTRASQRLEAVGQLAAGVAHDFNNLLTVINSYTEISIENIEGLGPTVGFLEEVLEAGQRAAVLTAQLLAFSRRQMLAPESLSINAVVEHVDPMLKRVLSEDIEGSLSLAEDLGSVRVDPAQLEQVIVNLAINARDAMPSGGALTIDTANVVLDDDYSWTEGVPAAPGPYVRMSVTDSGAGMTPDTLDRVFEPFFTTKQFGRGTGLGLATVHGIVTQSGGHVRVYSEPGVGTTFKVYFPRVDVDAETEADDTPTTGELRGAETILVAEDERALRGLLERVLTNAGYAVVASADGEEALETYRAGNFVVDLLVTDVVMPRVSGRELAETMLKEQPELRVLFISGYTDNAIVQHGVIDEGTNFLGKPFSANDLLRKVRKVLDAN